MNNIQLIVEGVMVYNSQGQPAPIQQPPTPPSPPIVVSPPSGIPAGNDWTAALRAGNGQDKHRVPMHDGWNVIEFTLPSGGYSRSGGGKLNVEPMIPQDVDIIVEVDGKKEFTQQTNSASIDIGIPGHGDGSPVMAKPGSRIKFAWRPVENQGGDALVEAMVPARGSAFVW